MKNIKKWIFVLAAAGGLLLFALYSILFASNTKFENEYQLLFIETDTSEEELITQITPFLKSSRSFCWVANQKKYLKNIKPGRFVLYKGMNNNELIRVLRSENKPIDLVIAPFDRIEEVAGYVSRVIEADSVSILEAFVDPDFLFQTKLRPENVLSLILPNTYEVYWNTSAIQFRNRMLKEYWDYWNENRLAKANEIKLSPSEVYNLAAIVSKESVKVDERPRVAGVYLNRLRKKMKLQADPTVVYSIKHTTGNFDTIIRRVLYRDLRLDNPYNTYKRNGLPIGPITMPEMSAIEAVLNAERHSYLYFVVDVERPGYHNFSKTLSEHNKKRRAYTKWLNDRNIRR
ncbi:MAG: endolytic transglycosylase MltG [Flavobacteriaceae bacterium]|nr:MAG: endolytic transglycosylase MltG [Bacteroidota bacterium]